MLFNRTFLAVSLYYSIIFMCGAVFTTYISLYYALIELTHTEVGWLSTVGAVVALLVQPMWGIASDRAKTKNKMLALSVLLSALTVWLIPLSGDMIWLLVLTTAVFTAFQCATHPLSDTITLELASRQGFTFSSVRTIGSLGFAIASAIAGFLFEDDITLMFPVYSVMLLFCLLCSLTIPPVEGHQSGKQKMSLSALFRNKKIVVIYLYTITIQSTIGFFLLFTPSTAMNWGSAPNN